MFDSFLPDKCGSLLLSLGRSFGIACCCVFGCWSKLKVVVWSLRNRSYFSSGKKASVMLTAFHSNVAHFYPNVFLRDNLRRYTTLICEMCSEVTSKHRAYVGHVHACKVFCSRQLLLSHKKIQLKKKYLICSCTVFWLWWGKVEFTFTSGPNFEPHSDVQQGYECLAAFYCYVHYSMLRCFWASDPLAAFQSGFNLRTKKSVVMSQVVVHLKQAFTGGALHCTFVLGLASLKCGREHVFDKCSASLNLNLCFVMPPLRWFEKV